MTICNKKNHKKTYSCGSPDRRLVTLEAMVREFIDEFRSQEHDELAFFKDQPFEVALDYAALAKDYRGKRFSHQRRLTRESLEEARPLLFAKKDQLQKAKSFEDVLAIVQDITATVPGLGELYAYDTALRISAAIGVEPSHVYLHAGTKVGAKRLGIQVKRSCMPMTELTERHEALQALSAHEAESFLCIYKNQFGIVAARRV